MRHKARRIAIFNHKGGVGKTTLTVNVAAALASKGKKTLIVDSDPQCNLTSHLIEDTVVDDWLDSSDSADGITVWSALKPLVDAEGVYRNIKPQDTSVDDLYLIPGDIQLAEFEVSLNDFWRDCFQRLIKGYRGIGSLSELINECAEKGKYDYVFYDTGPNIGALNRVILLDCDYFIVPAACDLFSVRALKTLGHTLASWIRDWKVISELAPNDIYLMPGKPKLLGYIPQQFKEYGQVMTNASAKYLSRLEKGIYGDVISVLREVDSTLAAKTIRGTKIGEVKDFSTLVQMSQQEGCPLGDVSGGAQYLKDQANRAFSKIANTIIKKTSGS